MAALALRLAHGETARAAGVLHVVDGLDGQTRQLAARPRHDCVACRGATAPAATHEGSAPTALAPVPDAPAIPRGPHHKESNMATVRIPTPLRKFSDGREEVAVDGHTVRDVLEALETACPGIGERIRDDKGGVRRFVNVFVADEDIRFLENLDTPVREGDEISIVPAIAGGR
jgi:molybdopterin converting factor small subunit